MISVRMSYSQYGSWLHKNFGVMSVPTEDGIELHGDEKLDGSYASWEAVLAATKHLVPADLRFDVRP